MATKIHNADEPVPVDLDGLQSGGQVVVFETAADMVNHYRQVLEGYHRWLNESTDIFDPVMVQVTMEFEPGAPNSLKLSQPYITDLVLHHLADDGVPVIINDRDETPDLEWWVKNNREIEVLEGGDPDEAERRTREAFEKDPYNFVRPSYWCAVNPDNTLVDLGIDAQGY